MKRLLYRWFSSVSAFQYRVARRFTRAGSLALGVLGAAVVIGLDTNRTVGYQVFTLVLALVLLSAASSLVFRGRFTARRILPRFASVGVPVTYRMAITNHTRRRQDGLVLLEELTDPRPTFEEFVTAREPGEERRNGSTGRSAIHAGRGSSRRSAAPSSPPGRCRRFPPPARPR